MALSQPAARPATTGNNVRNPYSVLPNWLYPTFVVVALSAFAIYAVWIVFFQPAGYFSPYLSPFNSPLIKVGPIPPGVWVAWAPFAFRLTCYYYRKAYYRAFFLDPPACAVSESKRNYKGETKFPFILQNLHRYFLYFAVLFLVFLWKDVFLAFNFDGKFGMGVGTLVLVVNIILLTTYTLSCHSLRHLAGGKVDCFSCATFGKPRYKAWQWLTILNERHMWFAWMSLISVGLADFYIRLVASGAIQDVRIF